MKKFNNYDETMKAIETGHRLPAGGYVCKILRIKYEEGGNGKSETITLAFDIVEGEYKDFFRKKYDNTHSEDKKWKGTVKLFAPTGDGSEQDQWTNTKFCRWIRAFELSNSGFVWDWDQNQLVGKLVGILFGETGNVIDGKEVLYTEARGAESVMNIRNNNFYVPQFKKKNGYTGIKSAVNDFSDGFMQISEEVPDDIPFFD